MRLLYCLLLALLPQLALADELITPAAVGAFFKQEDALFNARKIDALMAHYADNYVAYFDDGRLDLKARTSREIYMFGIFMDAKMLLSETTINQLVIADDGQSAKASLTTIERYMRQREGQDRLSSNIYKQDAVLRLIKGRLQIIRHDIHQATQKVQMRD